MRLFPKQPNMLLTVNGKDARIAAVKNFFSFYKSALTPYADEIVKAADKYGLDYRLIPAIAMQESNLCKKAPKDSYNCWGFGIYGKKVTKFDNYNQAIDTVTKTLATKYKAQGLETPEEIMSKYTQAATEAGQMESNLHGTPQSRPYSLPLDKPIVL